jgi:carbonic anhydrase
MFVHRNIANIVVHTDFNLLSVLQYSVEVLKVEHIIVCGHYGCGGVKAALGHQQLGLINKWLRNLKDLYRVHYGELNALSTDDEKADRLVELNVQEQVANLAKTSIIQAAWHDRSTPMLHGWVYDMTDGRLKPLTTFGPDDNLDEIYRFDFTTSPR